jgi:hypothetical protein
MGGKGGGVKLLIHRERERQRERETERERESLLL